MSEVVKKDTHRSNFLVRLPVEYRAGLAEFARSQEGGPLPAAHVVRRAVHEYLARRGVFVEPPEGGAE